MSLEPKFDPMGKSLLDFIHGKRGGEIEVISDYYEDEKLEVAYLFRNEESMSSIEIKGLDLCKGRILDIGAGSGSHSLILQNRGFKVTSLDWSKYAFEVMQVRGVQNPICTDINIYEDESYDTLLMMMNGLGIVESISGLQTFLHHAKKILNKQGKIIVDSADLLHLFEEEDGHLKIENLPEDHYYGEVTYTMKYEKIQGKPFKWLFLDFLNLKDIGEGLGWTVQKIEEDSQCNYLAELKIIS